MSVQRKSTVTLVIFIVGMVSIHSAFSISAENAIPSNAPETSDGNENYIIDDVPYVSQETGFYCRFASIAMLIKYYVDNTTFKEILHHSGIGYSTAYFRPFKLQPLPGMVVCQLSNYTGSFLAPLYGLSHEIWKAKITKNRWEQYWPKLKEKITQDIPVITDVDLFTLPWYKDYFNISNSDTHRGHSIVIVGFNETSGLVYFNDPCPPIFGEDEQNCTYVNMSIETFKDALKNETAPTTKYMIETFEKKSNPMSKEEAFLLAHKRNVERMKGNYSGILYRIFPFTDYGVEAARAMRKDLEIGVRHRFATMLLMRFFNIIDLNITGDFLEIISIEKHNISQYLLENQNLSPVCIYDGKLLGQESKHWKNLSNLSRELCLTAGNGFLKTIIESIPILKIMKKELKEIIFIEEKIIKGSDEHS